MKRSLRLVLGIGLALAVAGPAQAGPLMYSFTGTMGRGTLTIGGVEIDVTGADFRVSGITGQAACPAPCPIWKTTALYDFGALGSIASPDFYWQNPNDTGHQQTSGIYAVGLRNWYPGIIDNGGFTVPVSTAAMDATALTALGTFAPTYTNGSPNPPRRLYNEFGDALVYDQGRFESDADGNPLGYVKYLQISSATVEEAPEEVPEPATLMLIGVGVTVFSRRMRASRGRGAASSHS